MQPGSAPILDLPLRGEWRAINTPAERIPSHGTDWFAQRYAIDFARSDEAGTRFHREGAGSRLRHLTVGLDASRFLGWDAPVHAAAAGRVVRARDGWPDRARVRLAWEFARTALAPPPIGPDGDWRPVAGNHVVVEGAEGCTLYAHLRGGSLRVKEGDRVAAGDVLGGVGNSGNTTMPHLHFQLMDGPDALVARGVACLFRGYERWTAAAGWEPVAAGVPGAMERVRSRA